jgi:hypothetical protein
VLIFSNTEYLDNRGKYLKYMLEEIKKLEKLQSQAFNIYSFSLLVGVNFGYKTIRQNSGGACEQPPYNGHMRYH